MSRALVSLGSRAPRPRLAVTSDGFSVALAPARAAALSALARRRGARRVLGVALTRCRPCVAARLTARLERLLRRARRVGRLVGRGQSFVVFETDGERVRLIARPLPGGRFALAAADRAPRAGAPPAYLGELDFAELEAETQVLPMQGRVVWEPKPLTRAEARAKFGNERHHLVYIAVGRRGGVRKVGESTKLGDRYGATDADAKGLAKFYVGRVVDAAGRPLMGSYVTDAERLITRKLARMGVALPAHERPNPNEPLVTTAGKRIVLDRAVPPALRRKQLHKLRKRAKTDENRARAAEARRAGVRVDGRNAYELPTR